jgi:hypothetical protein
VDVTVAEKRPAPPRGPHLAVVTLVVAVIALAAFADHSPPPVPRLAAATTMPVAAPAGALSSSWFCAGPVATPSHLADGRLVIANAADHPLHGRITLIPSNGPGVTQDVQVGAASRLVVPEKMAAAAPYLGAVVELDGGQAAVQQVVSGSEGTSSTACATSGATSWYFATGTTQESSTLSVSLLNPYADDAIVDLAFTTEQGQENPQDFQGIVVPAGAVVGLDLGSHLRRRASVAATVTLRIGRVAAFETETVQAQSAAAQATATPGAVPWPRGVAVVRGAPSVGTSWSWPSGAAADGTSEQYVIYNPGPTEAQVALLADLDEGGADPFQVSVDPGGIAVVATTGESRIPKGVGHAAALRSTNGVGVVATRLVLATAPADALGVAELPGSQLQVRRWLVPGDGTTDSVNAAVVIYNPGSGPVTVSISTLQAPLDGQSAVVIAGHRRYVLAAALPGINTSVAGPMVVAGSGPIVVEDDVTPPKGGRSIDATIGIPLGP